MEIIDLIAKQYLQDTNQDGQIDLQDAVGSLKSLLGSAGDKLDLGSIVSKMEGLGLSNITSSWLGDGENEPIDGEQVGQIFDTEKLGEFANSMNLDLDSAKEKLSGLLPNLMDKASSGGALLDMLGEETAEKVAAAGGFFSKLKGMLGGK